MCICLTCLAVCAIVVFAAGLRLYEARGEPGVTRAVTVAVVAALVAHLPVHTDACNMHKQGITYID